jgi:hypothetical protein
MTVTVSENPYSKITGESKKPAPIMCGCCGGFATHRIEREECGVIIWSFYCKPCFDNQHSTVIAIDKSDLTDSLKVANAVLFRY